MAVIEGTQALKTLVVEYDFAVDAGAIGAIVGRAQGGNATDLPVGAVIEMGYIDVLTAFTTGTAATLAVQAEAANDIVSATVVSGAPWSSTGRKSIIPVGTGASAVKTTVRRAVSFVIATGTITAGKANIVLFYR